MAVRRDPTKALQIGFLVLLIVSVAQVGWWLTDQFLYSRAIESQLGALYRADAAAVTALYDDAATPAEIETLMPHLSIEPMTRDASVRPAALEQLAHEASRRNNRFFWEGGFFLAVLIGGMTVLTRTIRHDAELRRRQQNFLAAVSHEFKSPLASMRLSAETLMMRAREPDSQRLGRRILDDNERLLRMVDNLLDTARLEEGRRRLAPQAVELGGLIELAAAEIAERARNHGIEVVADVPGDLTMSIDPTALESVLRNLLDNALKACVAGKGRRIHVTARRSSGEVVLEVRDDGLGFAPEDAAMIFEKFYRLGDELRRSTPGTGLGLYIVRRLVELSGGRIEASSEGAGRGAVVVITWPAERQP